MSAVLAPQMKFSLLPYKQKTSRMYLMASKWMQERYLSWLQLLVSFSNKNWLVFIIQTFFIFSTFLVRIDRFVRKCSKTKCKNLENYLLKCFPEISTKIGDPSTSKFFYQHLMGFLCRAEFSTPHSRRRHCQFLAAHWAGREWSPTPGGSFW